MLPRLAVLLAVASSLGCNDLCGSERLPTCNVRDPGCRPQVQAIVECLRGRTSSELPPVTIITPATFEERLREGSDPMMMGTLEFGRALTLLGMLEPGLDLREASIASSLASVQAFYSSEEKAIYVIERAMDGSSIESVSTLAHELVHAAQDEESDLGALLDATRTHEELFRLRGVVEGEAMFYTLEAVAWHEGVALDELDPVGFWDAQLAQLWVTLDSSPSPYLVVYGLFPYLLGGRWASVRWQQGGDELVRASVSTPPESAAWLLMDPQRPGVMPPPRASAVCAAPPAPVDFVPSGDDEMGAPFVYGFLRRSGMTHAVALDLALRWRRDDLHVYAAPDGRVALAWRLVFAETSTPSSVAAQIRSAFRTGYTADTVVLLASDDAAALSAWTWTDPTPTCAPPP
jgi:hypothetical protein